jgi:hypothetical protein
MVDLVAGTVVVVPPPIVVVVAGATVVVVCAALGTASHKTAMALVQASAAGSSDRLLWA